MAVLAGKVAIITGASSGIARAAALLFASEGARLVLTAPRGAELDALAAEIELRGGEAVALVPESRTGADRRPATEMEVLPMTTSFNMEPVSAGASAAPLDAEEAWRAVLERDPAYADRFIYAVVTTAIYCRPGCASRAPRREHVRFFDSAAKAEAKGFRPCKRCRPDGDHRSAAQRSVERALEYLDEHLDETVGLDQLAMVTHTSPYHLQRTFKRQTGLTPREYVRLRRTARLKERLRAGDTVSRATFEAGFGSVSRVYDQAGELLGMTPAVYRDGGPGEHITFAVEETPLGWVLVAATERGICAVTLGDDPAMLEADLRAEYPRAGVARAASRMHAWVRDITAYLYGRGRLPELPLDLQASAFRWRVWKGLQTIPYGETRTYSQIAESIGAPRATRAVAQACAHNPVALVIPCHRVLRRDRRSSGYRWGADRKLQLLDLETGEPVADVTKSRPGMEIAPSGMHLAEGRGEARAPEAPAPGGLR